MQMHVAASVSFRAWLCGPFLLERRDGVAWQPVAVKDWGGSQEPRRLFKRLLSSKARHAQRATLLEDFWPDMDPKESGGYLTDAASKLRAVLQLVRGQGKETLLLTAPDASSFRLPGQEVLWVDADAALVLLEQAEAAVHAGTDAFPSVEHAATLLTRGRFLQEEDGLWAYGRRATVERAYRGCLLWQARLCHQRGWALRAQRLLAEHLEVDPTDEEAVCLLMELLCEQGRPAEALRLYRETRDLFKQEGLAFCAVTRALVERLYHQRQRGEVAHPDGATLAARALTPELPMLHEACDRSLVCVSADSGVLVPPSTFTDVHATTEVAEEAMDTTTWLATRVSTLKTVGACWQQSETSIEQQQARLHGEITRWSAMTDNEHWVTRRMALATMATLSTSLLSKVHSGPLTALVLDEFLAQCASSLTACWHLLRTDGLATVEYILPTYMPLLVALARQPSAYQRKAAYLASQGCCLMGIIHLHRLRFAERVTACQHAVAYARVAGDHIVLVTALTHLGTAFFDDGQPAQMLQAYQEAARFITRASQHQSDEIAPLLQSRIYMGLAGAYARLHRPQEAEYQLRLGCEVFPASPDDDLLALYADYDLSLKILWEGFVRLDVGMLEEHQGHSARAHAQYEQASLALSQIEGLPTTGIISERVRIEIVNQRALTAVKAGNLEVFEHHLMEGVAGAEALASHKRWQEIRANWKAARAKWPEETRVLKLADLVVRSEKPQEH